MALDYIIGGLQLLSAAVNVLALGAFWISPGLRATANRFVINLLVANIVACLALTPALWLHGGLKTRFHMDGSVASEALEFNPFERSTVEPLHQHVGKTKRDVHQPEFADIDQLPVDHNSVQESIESLVIERDEQGTVRKFSEKQVVDIQNGNEKDVVVDDFVEEVAAEAMAVISERTIEVESIARIKHHSSTAHRVYTVFSENALIFDCTRFWGFDFAAAVGVLSVVLVVGDTWCAVTDPLRYHSRISYFKSWLLIASVWAVSIVITIVSAFRSKWCHIELETNETLTEEDRINASTMSTTATIIGSNETMFVANIYALVFSCVYFVLIVLVPIAMICGMYYKIFSEARQSGLRMRRNGSSPLLQSSLNLNNSGLNSTVLGDNQRYPSIFDVSAPDALTMKIDTQQYGIEDGTGRKMPIATHQYRRFLAIPEGDKQPEHRQLCKRQRTKSEKSLNGLKPKLSQFRRHFSARHLVSLEKTCDVPAFLAKNHQLGRMIAGEIRQVHSSPNLQKLSNLDLLQKVPYCVNNRSTTSINQATQQSATSPRALSYMVSIRHRLSNASSIFKYREESRAARIGIVVVAMLLLSYLPYGLLILLQGRLTFIPSASLFSILFILIANISSPFIFAYRNRRVRRGVCRLFGVDTKPNSYLQKQRMQLRNSQNNQSNTKHVRIHRNLSASSFSLNMLPYKIASHSMLPIQGDQMQGYVPSRHGSVLVPIDDVECESNEMQNKLDMKKMDENNNRLNRINEIDAAKATKEKMSLLQRICSTGSRKSSVADDDDDEKNHEKQCSDTKDDAI